MNQVKWNQLRLILETMNVPSHRLDQCDVRWLLRNLPINNHSHPKFLDAMNDLKELARDDLREQVQRSGKPLLG
jgi:hypothetical protein